MGRTGKCTATVPWRTLTARYMKAVSLPRCRGGGEALGEGWGVDGGRRRRRSSSSSSCSSLNHVGGVGRGLFYVSM